MGSALRQSKTISTTGKFDSLILKNQFVQIVIFLHFYILKVVNDLKEYGKSHNGQDYVKLEMKFEEDYPFRPPFIRVVSPRFEFRSELVTVGGMKFLQKKRSSW
jgi:hypothetical protein